MANVLCQIRGTKRVLLFPPKDVAHFNIAPGASSSSINVFEQLEQSHLSHTHPHEALLGPGDVLYLPPLWLHSVKPQSKGLNIAINVFFRNLKAGYAVGKDIYGNRDVQAYEKGRNDIARIVTSFDNFDVEMRNFYLQRLLGEFRDKSR